MRVLAWTVAVLLLGACATQKPSTNTGGGSPYAGTAGWGETSGEETPRSGGYPSSASLGTTGPMGDTPAGAAGTYTPPRRSPETAKPQKAQAQAVNPEVDVEAIRATLLRARPADADAIKRMTILEQEDGVVVLRGPVREEGARPDIVSIVARSPGVVGVRDELETPSE